MVRVDELIDIQDKANFFLSIGQHDQAIAVLESHVHDQVETSALAWLDLLDLYHSMGKRDEYNHLREEFRLQFNADGTMTSPAAFSASNTYGKKYQWTASLAVSGTNAIKKVVP